MAAPATVSFTSNPPFACAVWVYFDRLLVITVWHTNAGCQSTFRENIGFFGFSIRSLSYRYTEWHPWDGDKLQADWTTMTGVELYDYRTVDMTDFDQFDRVNVAGQAGHDSAQKELATALHAHFNNM